ncbi:DUF6223 family protein [Actinokineospora sp. 24-640]
MDISPRSLPVRLALVAAATLIGLLGLAAPATAHIAETRTPQSVETGSLPTDTDQQPGRLGATVADVVGLIGVVIGGFAVARSTGRVRTGNARTAAITAALAALTAIALGALHLTRSTGGFGTGNGRAGAIVAILLGLTALVLAWLASARSRRTGHDAVTDRA